MQTGLLDRDKRSNKTVCIGSMLVQRHKSWTSIDPLQSQHSVFECRLSTLHGQVQHMRAIFQWLASFYDPFIVLESRPQRCVIYLHRSTLESQIAVTAYFEDKQLLLFFFAWQCGRRSVCGQGTRCTCTHNQRNHVWWLVIIREVGWPRLGCIRCMCLPERVHINHSALVYTAGHQWQCQPDQKHEISTQCWFDAVPASNQHCVDVLQRCSHCTPDHNALDNPPSPSHLSAEICGQKTPIFHAPGEICDTFYANLI